MHIQYSTVHTYPSPTPQAPSVYVLETQPGYLSWLIHEPNSLKPKHKHPIIAIYGPMIYTAQYVIHYKGHWKGWAIKVETFLGPETARAKRELFGPKNWAVWDLGYMPTIHFRVIWHWQHEVQKQNIEFKMGIPKLFSFFQSKVLLRCYIAF